MEEEEAVSRLITDELDRLVAAGTIREIDRERVRFIVRRIVQPPERPYDPLPENIVGSRLTRQHSALHDLVSHCGVFAFDN
jgi:hypothetical protein